MKKYRLKIGLDVDDILYECNAYALELLNRAEGIEPGERYDDCGRIIYDRVRQDVHGGGSGCGCVAAVASAYFIPRLQRGELRRILLMATGALMSPSSIAQGGSIAGIAPVICLEGCK